MSESQVFPYATHLDVKFPPLSLVDVPSLVDACADRWYNQTLCKVKVTSSLTSKITRSSLNRDMASSYPRACFTERAPRSVLSFSWSKLRRSFQPAMPDRTSRRTGSARPRPPRRGCSTLFVEPSME